MTSWFGFALGWIGMLAGAGVQEPKDRWEKEIQAFERKDKAAPPPEGGTVFVGSSNFARWSRLESDFKEFKAINRGFGGSCIPDVTRFIERIIVPYKPARIVLYGGPNEISQGTTPEAAFKSFEEFVDKVHEKLPKAEIYAVSLKPAPSRASIDAAFKKFNALVLEKSKKDPGIRYIDIVPVFTKPDGTLRTELYVDDQLHMNRKGEEACIPAIRAALESGR